MEQRATELEAEVGNWFAVAEATDAEEDKRYGADKTGEEMPDWIADKKRRSERIRPSQGRTGGGGKGFGRSQAQSSGLRRNSSAKPKDARNPDGQPSRPRSPPSPKRRRTSPIRGAGS